MTRQALFANRRVRINRNICMLVKRKLKGPGRILAQKNTEISPHDILGHYKLTLGYTKINVAQKLNVHPSEVPKYLNKPIGKAVYKGELVASKKGLFSTTRITAPTDVIFESLDKDTGEINFKMLPKDTSLTAGVFGVVEDVDHSKGEITIKTMMTEAYGVYGTGNEKEGFINLISGPADLVNKDAITQANRGQILVAGSLILEATIRKALSCSASGIICGGLNMDDYMAMVGSLNPEKKLGSEIGISIVATEGFGIVPIGDDFFEILKQYAGKYAILQGNIGRLLLPSDDPNSILSCRKVVLPPTEALGVRPQLSIAEIKIGSKVRLIAAPFMGSQGEVLAIDDQPTRLASGISTYLVTVGTKSKKIQTPFSNMELIN